MTIQTAASSFGIQGAMKRYSFMYHDGDTNHCPGCGHSHWHIGRATAECANCGTALAAGRGVVDPGAPAVLRAQQQDSDGGLNYGPW